MKQSYQDMSPAERRFEKKDVDLQKILFRSASYWPYLALLLIVCLATANLYLRYATPYYSVRTRIIVNDNAQEKSNNLLETLNASFGNVDKEIEKEVEILRSKSLISEVVQKQKFNVQWSTEGRVKRKPQFDDIPLIIKVDSPQLIVREISGPVKLVDAKFIEFNSWRFRLDSLEQSPVGPVRFHLKDTLKNDVEYILTLKPISQAADQFKSLLVTSPINRGSAIVDIALSDPIPARAEIFLNTMLEVYGENSVNYKNRIYQNTLRFVDDRLRLVSDELGLVEGQLEQLKSKEGIINLGAQSELFLSQINSFDQQLAQADIQLKVLDEVEHYIINRNAQVSATPATLGLTDPVLLNLLNQLFQAEMELEKAEKLSGDKNPNLEVLRQTISKLKPSILSSVKNLRINLIATKQKMQVEAGKLSGQLKNIPQKEKALLEISRQQQIKNNIYTFLLQKREEAALTAASQVPSHRIIDKPEMAGQVKPKRMQIYTIAFFMGLVVFAIFLYFKEFSSRFILFRDQLEKATGLPVIGELIYDDENRLPFVVGTEKRSVIAEQFREIRTNLAYLPLDAKGKVLLVTSSIPGEGKSFVSLNLAASLALAGKKTVLLEFDLRKPKLSKALKLERENGLSNFLIGKSLTADIIRPITDQENLYFISSGHLPPNPAELLMNGRLQELIQTLKNEFEYILIDSPPIGSVTDAKILANVSEAVIYIVRHGYTPVDFTELIRKQTENMNVKSLNLVFNGIKGQGVFGYSYGYGYGYGYGYSEAPKSRNKIKRFFSNLFSGKKRLKY